MMCTEITGTTCSVDHPRSHSVHTVPQQPVGQLHNMPQQPKGSGYQMLGELLGALI